jgi:hypothetical protein
MTNEDGPNIRVLWSYSRKARVDHECAFCHKPIHKGSRYTNAGVINDDGRFEYWKHCIRCDYGEDAA